MRRQDNTLLMLLTGLSAAMVMIAIYLALVAAPEANLQSATGRHAQRIIYFHIATAWVGFLAFFVTFVAGIGYLRSQKRRWDIVALSSAEISGRSPPLRRRTESSLLIATISTSPCSDASRSRCTCPTCSRSKQPLVSTTL